MDAKTELELESTPPEEKGSIEITLDNGEVLVLPTIKINKKKLYHGSTVSGITEILEAEEDTVGKGVYLTSEPMWASGYAMVRSSNPQNRIVYETEVENLTLIDLTNQRETLPILGKLMVQEIRKFENKTANSEDIKAPLKWAISHNASEIYKMVRENKLRAPRDLLFHFGALATNKLKGLGLDGIKAIEGGEGGNNIKIGDHDTYVIFDPQKVKVIQESQMLPYQHEEVKVA